MTIRIQPTPEDAAIIAARLIAHNRRLIALMPMTQNPAEQAAKKMAALKAAVMDYCHFKPEGK